MKMKIRSVQACYQFFSNEKALGIVNQEQLGVFAENANFQEYQINKDTRSTRIPG